MIYQSIKNKYMWLIVKKIKQNNGVEIPVLILNDQSEVLEFKDKAEAVSMRDIFQKNSDSGHEYAVVGHD